MIIYNVTTKVHPSIAEQWVTWLKEEHIPDLVQTGCFTHATILHLFESDDAEGVTYAVQYHAPSKQHYDNYTGQHAAAMRKKTMEKWGDKFISFRSVMQVVN